VSVVAIAPNRVPEIARIVGPERLTPWLTVKAERRAEHRRWIIRHADTLIGGIAVGLGLLLIPLPGPGWPLLTAGVLLLLAGAAARSTLRRRQT
jgi:hypothetical protein